MPTKYMIDVENIANKWSPYIEKLRPGDTIVLFYTTINRGHDLTVSIKDLHAVSSKQAKMEYIRCFQGAPGHNALDFQLATELGAQLTDSKNTQYVIVSRDKGFDVVVKYWQDKGFRITRTEPAHIISDLKTNTKELKQCRSYYESVCVANNVRAEHINTVVDIITEGMRRPESDRLLYIQNQLQKQIRPPKVAEKTYHRLREDLHRIKEKGPFPATNEPPRNKQQRPQRGGRRHGK